MPAIAAKKYTDGYRCGLPDCRALLFKGEIVTGKVEIKCKCGCLNKIESVSIAQIRPEGRGRKTA